eukprot:Skav210139  [mRNA]  locus=scaffold1493:184635:185549:+ [translate_table: standard]
MSVPPAFGRIRYILHAYSGRRRFGDIQHFIEKAEQSYPDIQIQVLSVDVIIDQRFGDLMDESTHEFWLTCIRDHLVVGLIAGPPCNSWSKVRRQRIEGSKYGPRPVRAPHQPWALPSLSLKELSQVFGGNVLLAFAVKALYALLLYGGVGLVEHPDDPGTDEDVSIWKLPLIAALCRHEEITLHHASQGYHGSESYKPTGLLALRLPHLEASLQRWCLSSWHLQSKTTGRADTGEYNTAKLKEYPPAFCGGVASAMCQALATYPLDEHFSYPSDFSRLCQKLVTSSRGDGIGLDTCTDTCKAPY